ncbi:dihydrodipicolinate synthase family protein [Halorarum halophilum]|uniref:Dihydrodipicolinate synthase family protein n=1 Tax=Halorarum halophilum TaxID=2743090 RepID=A0A7D5GBD3_9EURY|nr:dihydrodipicolinate synthase family protein [Halobaculum halophilum]QLG27352.1 dihydrodipicolinate synthase family protein [Halobaculum halophilum]
MDYEELKDGLRGVAFTNPTPFSEDGEDVLHDELATNVEWIVDRGAEVVIPCGNTGEYYSLSMDERAEVVATTAEAAGDATVVGGLGGSTKSALGLLSRYETAGVDAVMVMHPVHTYLHHEGIRRYYERIVEATDLGVVLYKRGPELTTDHLATLAEYDNVVAVKYADNDVKAFSGAISDTEDDVVWSNGIAERFALSFAIEGAEAFTTGIGNFVPEQVLALNDALREEDWDEARRIRDLLRPYEDLREDTGDANHVPAANNVPAVKFGQELAGLYGGPVREPLVDLSEADRERAETYYDRITSEV